MSYQSELQALIDSTKRSIDGVVAQAQAANIAANNQLNQIADNFQTARTQLERRYNVASQKPNFGEAMRRNNLSTSKRDFTVITPW